ncbi:MAG TPA: tetratricopeptide repeat protein [Herbaspirillum sp.]|jgi:tetratricopeptide (TPR) repeat protein
MNSPDIPFAAKPAPAIGDEEIETLYSIAHQLHSGGMRAKALDLFALVAAYRPRSIRYNKALGISLMGSGDYEKAIPILATAILCDTEDDPSLAVAFAECLALTDRRRQALRLFQKARIRLNDHADLPEAERLLAHADRWMAILGSASS